MPSPVRRSARGAPPLSKPAKPTPPASTASSSSLSSARQDRTVRDIDTHQKSVTPRSLSSEETSEPPRRSQRSQLPKDEEAVKDSTQADDDTADEGEVTRCVCGAQEYPGTPLSEAFTAEELEDPDCGSLFISCDSCSVWQHAGCVGIAYDHQVPDKYYCELCRPKRHELHTDSRGQKYSLYSDVSPKKRVPSVSKHGEKAQKERDSVEGRASADPVTGRRRGTTRSKEHDDEEEQIRRAIEESKREVEGGKRGGKRGRDESEDTNHIIKRQRRSSELQSKPALLDDDDSSDELASTSAASKGKKSKGDSSQSARQSEMREKESEREKARAEAAGRRQERAGRRRVEEERAEDTPKQSASNRTSPPPTPPQTAISPPPPEKVSHKKGAGKKSKRLGNNQYTNKIRHGDAETETVPASSPQPSGHLEVQNQHSAGSSGDERLANGRQQANGHGASNKHSPERSGLQGNGNGSGNGGGKAKFGKGKHKGVNGNGSGNGAKHGGEEKEPAELTLGMMKRRVEAMAAFVAKAQGELAGDQTPASSDGYAMPTLGGDVNLAVKSPGTSGGSGEKRFEELGVVEMGEAVARRIGEWHARFDQFA